MIYVGERRTWMKSAVTAKAKVERWWSKINVKGTGSREKHDILNLCAFSRRGMLRTCAGTRSWEKKWQHEKLVLRPTLKAPTTTPPTPPTLRNTPLPTFSHMSPTLLRLPYSPILLWIYHSLRHHPETVGGSNGVGGRQKKARSHF